MQSACSLLFLLPGDADEECSCTELLLFAHLALLALETSQLELPSAIRRRLVAVTRQVAQQLLLLLSNTLRATLRYVVQLHCCKQW